ncbi:MAG TPA: hypothetical protein VFW41_08125 [Gaiellaceae bacterium]|nr:hypothetical protein [Gaiellaceae bacterium]
MTKKQHRIPGMHAPNRAERRDTRPHVDEPPRDESPPKDIDTGRGRRKTTAENWNQ